MRGRDGRGFGRGMQGGRGGRGAPTQQEPQFSFGGKRSKTQPGRGGPGGRGGRMGGRGYMRLGNRKMDRVPSLAVGAEWSMVEEFDLPALLKLVANPPQVEDLVWTGHLDQYDEAYDKLTTRSAKPLKRIENKVFYAVRTADDPILEKFAVEEIGNVYATDAILALLMASPRSVYSWDITIEKTNGILFLDKRENSLFDFLTVSETAREPPQATEDIDEINHPEKLSIEATMINQNFSQQVLKENDPASRKTVSENTGNKTSADLSYACNSINITTNPSSLIPQYAFRNSSSPILSSKTTTLVVSLHPWLIAIVSSLLVASMSSLVASCTAGPARGGRTRTSLSTRSTSGTLSMPTVLTGVRRSTNRVAQCWRQSSRTTPASWPSGQRSLYLQGRTR